MSSAAQLVKEAPVDKRSSSIIGRGNKDGNRLFREWYQELTTAPERHEHSAYVFVMGSLAELKEHAKIMTKFPEMEHDDPNAISVEPGKTGELVWRFTKAGKFDFACLVPGHFEAGMQGKIAVRR